MFAKDQNNNLPFSSIIFFPSKLPKNALLKSNPPFNPSYLARHSRFSYENCLSYAFNHRLGGPDFRGSLRKKQIGKGETLNIFVKKINKYFKDPDLVKIAEYQSGELPDQIEGYYIISLAISYETEFDTANQRRKHLDYHCLVQNSDGYFSHRRGKSKAERLDCEGNLIIIPEKARLFYQRDQNGYYDYEFIGYLYVKINANRIKSMQETDLPIPSLLNPQIPREFPKWEIIGDFKCQPYDDSYPLNRKMIFINKLANPMIKEVRFLGYKENKLRIKIKFFHIDLCNDFLNFLPESLISSSNLFPEENQVYFDPITQQQFDEFMSMLHRLYVLNEEILLNLTQLLNTRLPVRITNTDWMQSYPKFDSNSNSDFNRFGNKKNCLNYALTTHSSTPDLPGLDKGKDSKLEKLNYVVNVINQSYNDQTLVFIAEHKPYELPLLRQGYYVISLHISYELGIVELNGYYQAFDYHFLAK